MTILTDPATMTAVTVLLGAWVLYRLAREWWGKEE